MNNTLKYDFESARLVDGQSQTRIGEVETKDFSPLRALQGATRQILGRFAATFEEDYVPAATFSFAPAENRAALDETEYLLKSPANKARLLAALERSRAREAARIAAEVEPI